MFAFVEFNPDLGFWSPFTFWLVLISIVLAVAFTVVVFFGGLVDLRFLLRAMDEKPSDDDARIAPSQFGDTVPEKV